MERKKENKRSSRSTCSTESESGNEEINVDELPYNHQNKVVGKKDIECILKEYGVDLEPQNLDFYRTSFVHPSYCTRKNENFSDGNIHCPPNCLPLQELSYERFEFLGDTILGSSIGDYLYDRFPDDEGFLTKMRTKLVNGKMLSHLCSLTKLPEFVIISKQIENNNGRYNIKILEDIFEAFIGAMFKDFCLQQETNQNINAFCICQKWIVTLIEENIDFTNLILSNTNYKDQMLKYFVLQNNYVPHFYEINHETTPTGKRYDVCIKDNMQAIIATGSGPNKKAAENDASYNALKTFGEI